MATTLNNHKPSPKEDAENDGIDLEFLRVKHIGENSLIKDPQDGGGVYISNKREHSLFYHMNDNNSDKILIKFKPEFSIGKHHTKNKFFFKIELYNNNELLIPPMICREEYAEKPEYEKETDSVISYRYIVPKDVISFEVPNIINIYEDIKIIYYAGDSKNPKKWHKLKEIPSCIYVAWKKADRPETMGESLFYYTCTSLKGVYPVSEVEVFNTIWKKFQININQPLGNLWSTDFDFTKSKGRVQFTYYRTLHPGYGWGGLIDENTGDCGAFMALLESSLSTQGLTGQRISIRPKNDQEEIMVKNWLFKEQTTSGDLEYPYKSVIQGADFQNEKGEYLFIEEKSDVIKLEGLNGHNNVMPTATFDGHWILLFNNRYYDPSYGLDFDNFEQWKKGAVEGFMKKVLIGGNTRIFRKGHEDVYIDN
ncbi:MAG: hypothetical protein ACK5KL_20395 [Dysgonomonas sp.]